MMIAMKNMMKFIPIALKNKSVILLFVQNTKSLRSFILKATVVICVTLDFVLQPMRRICVPLLQRVFQYKIAHVTISLLKKKSLDALRICTQVCVGSIATKPAVKYDKLNVRMNPDHHITETDKPLSDFWCFCPQTQIIQIVRKQRSVIVGRRYDPGANMTCNWSHNGSLSKNHGGYL